LKNNAFYTSHSNEQVPQYKYQSTVQSVITENNQGSSKNINTEFVQQIHSSNELNLNDTNNDSNGRIKFKDNVIANKYESFSYNKLAQYKTNQDSNDFSEVKPTETRDYEDNQITQQSTSSMRLQKTDNYIDTSGKSHLNQPPTSNGNELDTFTNEILGTNGSPVTNAPPSTNASPATSTNTPTGVTPYDMLSTPSSKTLAPNSGSNGGIPSTTTSSSRTNGSPSGSPTNPKEDLTTVPSEIGKNNGLLSYSYMSTIIYPTDLPDYFDLNYNPQSMSPTTGNGVPNSSPIGEIPTIVTSTTNSYDSLIGDDYSFNSYDDFYDVPQTVYETPTDQIPDNYNFGFEYQNFDQVPMYDSNMLVNYGAINNDGVNTPVINEDEFYNKYYYDKSSVNVNNIQSPNWDYDLTNYGSNVDDYYDKNMYDNGNQPEYSYEEYESYLNSMHENSQMHYGLNQNTPPSRGYSLSDYENRPYGTDIYPYNGVPISYNPDVYNYDNRVDMQYGNDQSGIGIDDMNPDTQITSTIDSYSNIDMISGISYDSVNGNNKGREIIDSIGQVNKNTADNGQTFNEYLPKYNQLNDDYTTTYLSNLNAFEVSSSSKTETNIPDVPYVTPKFINSDYNSLTDNNLDKQSSDLNYLLIDSTQLNGYLYGKFNTPYIKTQVEGLTEDSSNGFTDKIGDDLLNINRKIDLSKSNALDVGQNVYGTNGQVIGKIFKPSNDTRKNNNLQNFSGSSSYSSHSDSEFSEEMHAIGNDIKRAARNAIDIIYDKTKDAYDNVKNVGKTVGNAVGNAAINVYQGTKNVTKNVGNAVGNAANAVKQTANNAYQNAKYVANGLEDVASDTKDGIKQTAKTAYQGTKDVINSV